MAEMNKEQLERHLSDVIDRTMMGLISATESFKAVGETIELMEARLRVIKDRWEIEQQRRSDQDDRDKRSLPEYRADVAP